MNRIQATLKALSLGVLLMSSAPAQERRPASKVPPALLEAFDRDGDGRLNGAEATAARRALDDPSNVRSGWVLPDEGYCDQPLVARLADGTWLTVLTTGAGHEGQRGQHVMCARSSDQGSTWSAPLDIEPASGPEASWAQPIVAPSGRVFAFYIFNDSGIEDRRADMLGSFVMRWSDDGGLTWSERATIPVRETAIDRENG